MLHNPVSVDFMKQYIKRLRQGRACKKRAQQERNAALSMQELWAGAVEKVLRQIILTMPGVRVSESRLKRRLSTAAGSEI